MHSRLLRDRLELTRRLAAEAIQARSAFRESPTEHWESRLAYKSASLAVEIEGGRPVFRLLKEAFPNEVAATFSSPQEAAKAAVEYHRVDNLSGPRYEVLRQPLFGVEYERDFAADSPEEAVEGFRDSMPAFDGGGLIIWDQHEYTLAAYLDWTCTRDHGEAVAWSSRQVYPDQELAAAAQRLDQRKTQRERISAGRTLGL